MSSTRLIHASLTNDEVLPTKSLGFLSMPCEIRAAAISIKTKNAIKKNDEASIAHYYLLNKEGEKNTTMNIMLCLTVSLCSLMSLIILHAENEKTSEENTSFQFSSLLISASFISLLYSVANMLPNIANNNRYQQNKKECKNYLKTNNPSYFTEIKHRAHKHNYPLERTWLAEHLEEACLPEAKKPDANTAAWRKRWL